MMKKILLIAMSLLFVGCSEKKPLTPEEQWHGFCTSVGNAARSIVFDRQQAIEKTQAVEHANKIEDEITKKFILNIIEKVYALFQDRSMLFEYCFKFAFPYILIPFIVYGPF